MNEIDTLIPTVTREEINLFCANLCNHILTDYRAQGYTYPGWEKITVEYTEGGRYYRVTRSEPGSKFIYCLVDKSTGDIYKPTSFSGGPAKHVRGNIRTNYWGTCCQRNGIINLR